jgi:hypothetical protein
MMEVSMRKTRLRIPLSVVMLTAGLLGLILTSRCSFDEPSAPTWDVSLVVPLADRVYTMVDLTEDADEVVIDPQNQNVIYQHRQDIESFEVGPYLRIDGGEDAVTMFLPPHTTAGWDTTLNGEVYMSEAIIADSAEIAMGYADFCASNPTGYNLLITVTVPSLTINGEPISVTGVVQQDSGCERVWLNSAMLLTGGTNVVDYTASVEVIGGDDSLGGPVDVSITISGIYFKTVKGTLDHLAVELDSTEMDFEVPEELEGFQVQTADLELSMMLSYMIPADVHLIMEAIDPRVAGMDTLIALDATLTPTSPTEPTVVDLGDVAEIFNSHPERILIYGNLELGDGQTAETLRDTDRIAGTVLIEAPLVFSLSTDTTEVEPDTLDIDEEDRETIRDNIFHAKLEAEVGNHLPFGTRVTLLFDTTRADSTLYDESYTPDLVIGPLVLSGPPTEGDPGLVTEEVVSELIVDLNKDDLAVFENEQVYMGTRVVILGTGDQMVKVRPSDYLHVRANVQARIRTDFEDDE